MKNIEKPQPPSNKVGGRASVVFYQQPQQIVGYSIAKEILLSIADSLGVVRDHHWNGWHVLDLRTGKICMYVCMYVCMYEWSIVVTAKRAVSVWSECWWQALVWEKCIVNCQVELAGVIWIAKCSECSLTLMYFTSFNWLWVCPMPIHFAQVWYLLRAQPYWCLYWIWHRPLQLSQAYECYETHPIGKCGYLSFTELTLLTITSVWNTSVLCAKYHNRGKQHHTITSPYPTSNSSPSI